MTDLSRAFPSVTFGERFDPSRVSRRGIRFEPRRWKRSSNLAAAKLDLPTARRYSVGRMNIRTKFLLTLIAASPVMASCGDNRAPLGVVDAGTPDSSVADSSTLDSGSPDGSVVDSSAPDSGSPDSNVVDSNVVDSNVVDSRAVDSGTPDSRVVDAGPICGSGTGDPESPILICTVDDLINIQNGLSLSYQLIRDIDLTGVTFSPIQGPFTGTLSGNGHQLQNLTITDSTDDNVGLFAQSQGATFTELIFSSVSIDATGYTGTDARSIGTLVGSMNGGTASSITVTSGTLTTNSTSGIVFAGGIAGQTATGTIISNSNSRVNLTDTTTQFNATSSNRPSLGGIVGNNASGATVETSYAVTTITSSLHSTTSGVPIPVTLGGIAGINGGSIQQSFASAQLSCVGCNQAAVGGIAGGGAGPAQNVYATGNMKNIGTNPNSGGILGNSGGVTITNSLSLMLIPAATSNNQGGLRRNCGGTCGSQAYWITDLASQGTTSNGGTGGEETTKRGDDAHADADAARDDCSTRCGRAG